MFPVYLLSVYTPTYTVYLPLISFQAICLPFIFFFFFLFIYPPIYLPISNLPNWLYLSITALFFHLSYRHRITNLPLSPSALSFHSLQKLFRHTMANIVIMNKKMKDFPAFKGVVSLPCYAFLICGHWNRTFPTYFFF